MSSSMSSILVLLNEVKCDVGTLSERFDCETLVMVPGGWDRHAPGDVAIAMLDFEGPGAPLVLESMVAKGMMSAFGCIPESGTVGILYVRQEWRTNGRSVCGRFGVVLRIGP